MSPFEKPTAHLMPVGVGDAAPDFALPDAQGRVVRLSDHCGRSVVVLFFFPKAGTMGCTKESCAFRDAYETFAAAGAAVIGVSADAREAQAVFAARHRLPFVLLSDTDGEVRRRYGVPTTWLGLIPGRVTYVIDCEGVVRHVFNSQFRPAAHVEEALRIVRRLQETGHKEPRP